MTRKLFAACVLFLSIASIGTAQSTASSMKSGAHYTKAQVKMMAMEASTPEQYSVLASYYEGQKRQYMLKADEEKKEWIRRSQNITSSAAKYPRPVDSARNLYEYNMSKASEAEERSLKFNQLVAKASISKEQ